MTRKTAAQRPIQDFILAGLAKMIRTELQVDAKFTKTDDMSDVFMSLAPSKRQGTALAALTLDSLTMNKGGSGSSASSNVRPHALTHLGARGALIKGAPQTQITFGDDGNSFIVTRANLIKAVPVNMSVTLRYAAVDEADLMGFFAKWVFASANRRLNFNLDYCGVVLPIEVELSEDLSVPDKPLKGEAIGYMVYEGQFVVGGWFTNPLDNRDNASVPTILSTTLASEVLDEK